MGENGVAIDKSSVSNTSGNMPQAPSNADMQTPFYRIVVLSDLFAGTPAFSKENLIGLAEYFRNEKKSNESNAPAHYIFVLFGGKGGIFPYIPLYEQQNQLKLITEGINFISNMPALLKPAFERLLKSINPEEFYVVLGTSDRDNIEAIAKDLRIAYSHKPNWLRNELIRTEISMEGSAEIIKNTKVSVEALNKQLQKHPGDAKLIAELKNAKEKLKINEEEYAEFKERKKIIETLINSRIERMSTEELKDLVNQLKEELKKKEKRFDELKNGNGSKTEYERLAMESKAISNMIRAANHRLAELSKIELESMVRPGSARIEAFTHNVRVKPDIEKIIYKLAEMYYFSYIREFSRKYNAIVPDKDLVFVSKKINSFEFTIALKGEPILGTSSKMYNKKSNTAVTSAFYSYIETAGNREVLQKDLTVLISGGHAFTSVSIESTFDLDREKKLVSLAKGPFADREKIAELFNERVVTRTNKIVDKSLPLDSGASVLDVYPGGKVVHTYISSERLKIEYNKVRERELAVAKKLIERKEKEGLPDKSSVFKEEVRNKQFGGLKISQKLPSELKKDEVSELSPNEIFSLIPPTSENTKNVKKISVVAFSDIHFGGGTEADLLEKSVEIATRYIRNLEPGRIPILLLNGDIIEGNLKNYKNSPMQLSLPRTSEQYRAWLLKQGLSEEQVNSEMVKYYESINIIQNISAQAGSIIEKLLPVILETINKNGYIIIVSGNHFNNTDARHEHDEATELADKVNIYLKGKGFSDEYISEHVKSIPGDEYGISNIFIDDDNVIRVQHKLAKSLEKKPQAIIKKRVLAAAVFESHYHEPKQTVTGGLQTFETPAMQYEDENTYTLGLWEAISDATRGFAISEIDLRGNQTIWSRYMPVLRADLERSGELKEPLYQLFRKETLGINISKTTKKGKNIVQQ